MQTIPHRVAYFDSLSLDMHPIAAATDTEEPVPPGLPGTALLMQNYPNPFASETRVEYHVTTPTPVVVTVMNVLGQEVRTVVDAWKGAGRYSVLWDGRDHAGWLVPDGVYLYRIETKEHAATRSMVLIR